MLNMEMSQVQYAYTGDIIALVLSQLAAAFAAVKAIDAAIQTTSGFYYSYRGGSSTGDLIGLYELLAVFSYLTWSLVISIVGYVASALLWEEFEKREKGAKEGGFFGVAFAANDGYKYIALGCIIGAGAWISSIALGDSAKELLGFFANYNTKQEGTGNNASSPDADGTSIGYDLGYHVATLAYYYLVSSAIWLGGIIFGFVYMFPSGDIDCDVANIDQARYAPVQGLLDDQKDVESCKVAVGKIFNIADVNGDG